MLGVVVVTSAIAISNLIRSMKFKSSQVINGHQGDNCCTFYSLPDFEGS